jgi:hypothetical protein
MSDPRFEREPNRYPNDPNLPPNQYVNDPNRRPTPFANRESTAGPGSLWIGMIIALVVVAAIAAYSYRGNMTASNTPATTTTSGQATRTPVPTTPPATPVAPEHRP